MPEAVKTTPMEKKVESIDLATIIKYRLGKGMSYPEISAITGAPISTIHKKFTTFMSYCDPETVKQWEKNKAEVLSIAEQTVLTKMMEEGALKKASVNNLAYALGTINNINRLHRGQSTSNQVNLNVELSDTRYQEMLQRQHKVIVNPENGNNGNDVKDI